VPLKRGGRNIYRCPDFSPDCVHEFEAGDEERLADEVHHCGMNRHGIRIRIVFFGPQEVREESGDEERGSDLSKLSRTGFSRSTR